MYSEGIGGFNTGIRACTNVYRAGGAKVKGMTAETPESSG